METAYRDCFCAARLYAWCEKPEEETRINGYIRGFWDDDTSEERLPNGYTRKDYYEYGFSDFDIEFWGMDQLGAPDPFSAGWVIWDALDGELDGEIDF